MTDVFEIRNEEETTGGTISGFSFVSLLLAFIPLIGGKLVKKRSPE
jgi:hypothetical protein